MTSIKSLFIFSLVITQLSGCASVLKGVEQEMTFKSDPEGATVFVDGLKKGQTPLTVKLRKDEYKRVTLKKKAYQDHVILLQQRFDKIGLINIILPTGFTTDASTGAMFAYVPGTFYINLTKLDGKNLSNRYLQRDTGNELREFVFINYIKLKQQCVKQCDSESIQTLTWLVAKEYKKANTLAREYVRKALITSNNPIEYLRQLESDIKADPPQVVAIKGKQ